LGGAPTEMSCGGRHSPYVPCCAAPGCICGHRSPLSVLLRPPPPGCAAAAALDLNTPRLGRLCRSRHRLSCGPGRVCSSPQGPLRRCRGWREEGGLQGGRQRHAEKLGGGRRRQRLELRRRRLGPCLQQEAPAAAAACALGLGRRCRMQHELRARAWNACYMFPRPSWKGPTTNAAY
jgi:hypothetical protein